MKVLIKITLKYGDLKVSLDGSLGAGFGLERLMPSRKLLNFVFFFSPLTAMVTGQLFHVAC